MRNMFKKDKLKYILALIFTLILTSCTLEPVPSTDLRSIDKDKVKFDTGFMSDEYFDPTSGSFGGNIYQIDTASPNQGYYFNIYEYKNGNISNISRTDDFYIAKDEYLVVETLSGNIHSVIFGDDKYQNILDYKYKNDKIFEKNNSIWNWTDDGDFKNGGIFIFSSSHSDKKNVNSYDLNETGLDALTRDKSVSGIVIELRLSDE